ncbi:MAG: hypothetical protein AB8B94_16565 [Hyphomicrobiales bacterium]
MTVDDTGDLDACRYWQKAVPFVDIQLGIVPRLNAVTALNATAAVLWNLLADTGDRAETIVQYRKLRPDRQEEADADLNLCLDIWQSQGLLGTPLEEDDQREVLSPPSKPPVWERTITIGGRAIRLEVDDPELASSIEDLVAPFPKSNGTPSDVLRGSHQEGVWFLFKNGSSLRSAETRFDLRIFFLNELGRCAGGETEWHAIAHGASLEQKGVGIFLAGPSGSGKSTLSAYLVHRGWRLLAEDSTAFDENLKVQPLPFSLSVKSGSVDYLAQFFPDLLSAREHRLGARRVRYQPLVAAQIAPEPASLDFLFHVQFDPKLDHDDCQISEMTPTDRLEFFLNNQSYVNFEQIDQSAFFEFLKSVPAFGITYGSCEAAEHAIKGLLKKCYGNTELDLSRECATSFVNGS